LVAVFQRSPRVTAGASNGSPFGFLHFSLLLWVRYLQQLVDKLTAREKRKDQQEQKAFE
jgi:hypothetical protein